MQRSYEDENNRNITWFLGGNTYSKPRSEKKLAADQQDNRGICTGRTEKGSSANDGRTLLHSGFTAGFKTATELWRELE